MSAADFIARPVKLSLPPEPSSIRASSAVAVKVAPSTTSAAVILEAVAIAVFAVAVSPDASVISYVTPDSIAAIVSGFAKDASDGKCTRFTLSLWLGPPELDIVRALPYNSE